MPGKAEETTDEAEGGSVAAEPGISDEAYEVRAEALVADAAAADRSKTAAMDYLGD